MRMIARTNEIVLEWFSRWWWLELREREGWILRILDPMHTYIPFELSVTYHFSLYLMRIFVRQRGFRISKMLEVIKPNRDEENISFSSFIFKRAYSANSEMRMNGLVCVHDTRCGLPHLEFADRLLVLLVYSIYFNGVEIFEENGKFGELKKSCKFIKLYKWKFLKIAFLIKLNFYTKS